MSMTKMQHAMIQCVLIAITAAMIVPLFTMLFTSLKGDGEFLAGAGGLLPREWKFENYAAAWNATNWSVYFQNSIIVTAVAVTGSLLINTLSGYAFARIDFKGRDVLFILVLLGLMVPAQVTIIPQFLIMKQIPFFGGNNWLGQGGTGWLDTHYALIVPELAGSLGIFLARQFYLSFPKELDEAARMDGAGYIRTYFAIYLPLSGALIATLGILKTVYLWNDFFHPLIFTTSDAMRTIQLGLQAFRGKAVGEIQFNLLMAATLIVSLPMIAAFLVFQKHFVKSAVSSSVKG